MGERRRIVLFLPRRADPARGESYAADLLPLELLRIAGGPAAEGHELVLVDAALEEDALPRVLEACEGALLLAGSCILGYQVYDGWRIARAVRERHPRLPIVWGGWFPSVAPELYLSEGIADAVAIGQGEQTFLDLVHALECGAPLEEVAGLALWREGALVRTAPRSVVGFERLPAVPWHLLEFERYVERQLAPERWKVRHRMPPPRAWRQPRPPIGFSHVSSFGCPEPCTFCCSPLVTGRRWKAIPGPALADEVLELHGRFGFECVRFQDANWGVAEKRAREFALGLLASDRRLHWNATIEIESVQRFSDETLDLLAESGCHLMWLGAEAADRETQERIQKRVRLEHVPEALRRLDARGITTGTFWIVGFPGESEASMRATLAEAARIKRLFPGSASEVYPFRAIPGTADWDAAVRLGWDAPRGFEEWGRCFEWKWNSHHTPLPRSVRRELERYAHTAALYDRHPGEGPDLLRRALGALAGWRLDRRCYALPLEQKLFDWYVRLSGQRAPGAG